MRLMAPPLDAARLLADRPVPAAVLHWHKADPVVTRTLLDLGVFLGITPEVRYRERDRRLVGEVSLARLLAESDGPWEYGGPWAGRPGEPSMVTEVAAAIAHIRDLPLDAVADRLDANARRCFGDAIG
jgi:TatD DNase family protein